MNTIVTFRMRSTSAVALRAAAKLRGVAASELIRQAVDREIRSEPTAERQASRQSATEATERPRSASPGSQTCRVASAVGDCERCLN